MKVKEFDTLAEAQAYCREAGYAILVRVPLVFTLWPNGQIHIVCKGYTPDEPKLRDDKS